MNIPATRQGLMKVNMGPHHPSMHDVIDCEPILGYLHRGMEKIAKKLNNYTISTLCNTLGLFSYYLGNIQVPKRASYIRVIMLELSRIASHILWLGPFMADIGAQTPFFYIFRERELVYDLFEAATGMRTMRNYFHIGGVTIDLPHGWIDKCLDFCNYFLTGGVGIIGREKVINWVDHYECCDEFDREVQWQKEGDSLARYLVRIGIFLTGDQSVFPWRWKICPPGFINLQILPQLVKIMKLANIITVLGSIDIIMGEVDR
ncbi:hypothetical protein UlMin_006406 [Ulmus minor]